MRIFIGESDRCEEGTHRGRPLHEALLHSAKAGSPAPERVRVILYRPGDVPEIERGRHRLTGLKADE
jgi:hypothetical protein